MRIRAANSVDAPRLVDILVSGHAKSRYAGHVGVDQQYARRMLAQAVNRHGHTNEGGCWVQVAENNDGSVIEAFVFGVLNRVYQIGDRLCAQDVFLIGRDGCDPRALDPLFDSYVGWALTNPRVFEIFASHTDVLPQSDRFGAVYQRKGFVRCGAIFRRECGVQAMGVAA